MNKLRSMALIGLLSVVAFSCKKNVDVEASEPEETPPGIVSNEIGSTAVASPINEAYILQLVNDVRARGCNCGGVNMPPVAPVQWNEALEATAYRHSNDMYTKNFFSHTGSDGSNVGTRARAAGYSWRSIGENIAKGYLNEQKVINGWLGSPGHCKNMMNAKWKDVAVSKVGSYWTQVFGLKF